MPFDKLRALLQLCSPEMARTELVEVQSILKVVRTHFAACGGEGLAKNSACPSVALAKEGTEILNFDNFKFSLAANLKSFREM